MPLQTNSIGGFSFICLKGQVIVPSYQVVSENRPGVDGTEFILVGNKGTPFTLLSQVDCASFEDAYTQYAAYQSLKVAAPVVVIQGGVPFAGMLFKVLSVELASEPKTIRGAVGNKLGASPNEGFLECRWDLQAVPL